MSMPSFLDHAPDVIACYDRDLRHTYVNRAVERETGIPPESFLGRTPAELGVPEPLAALWSEALGRGLRTGEVEEVELEFPTPWGDRWFRYRISPEIDAAGAVRSLVAIGRNVTPQRQTEARLREVEERFHELTSNLRQVFWLVSIPGQRLVYASPAFERIWGRSVQSLYDDSLSLLEAVHPDHRERVAGFVTAVLEERLDCIEYCIRRPDGTERWVSVQGFPVRDAEGRVYRIAGISEDITDRKRVEEERERVLAIVSHDLRSPLTSILLQTELIRQRAGTGDMGRVLEAADHVRATAERMERLISDLLSLATIEAGGLRLQLSASRVGTLLDLAAARMRPLAAARGIEIAAEDHAGIPVIADPERIGQVLDNLVENAIRFAPAGSRVTVESQPRDGKVWISVRDTGEGIPEQDLPHVFDRYWQASSGSRGGAGLGLAIARGIVEAHGGQIWVVSGAGEGTTFVFTLATIDGAAEPG